MKLTGKPIYPAELAPTGKVTAIETDYKAADKTLSDKNTTQDTAIAAVKTTADKAATDITALTTTVTNNKTAQDAAISSAIAEWAADRQYSTGNTVMRQNGFFKALANNKGVDPLTDKSSTWSIFTPGAGENEKFANRSPNSTDKWPVGVKWYDQSFGVTTPLAYVSLGEGAWTPLNQITLSRVRFYVSGVNSTYQSNLNSIKFFKKDGTQAPNSWWVWGSRSGLGGQTAGSNYTGQSMGAGYNASGWAELEPSSSFDLSESITKVTGSTGYANVTKVEFYYSNNGLKTFTPGGGNLATCDPALPARYGDSVAAVLGETLTAAKLTNASNIDPGRITGESFVAAYNILSQAMLGKIAALETKISILSARVPDSPPPTHANARPIADGQFINIIPGGGEFTYGTSRSAGTNSFTYPTNTYKEAVSYYLDANDAIIPMTQIAQMIAADSTSLSIGAIAVSLEAIVYVVEFVKLDDSKITYRVPLS